MGSRQHAVRGGWTSHRNFLSLGGNPRRLIKASELKGVVGLHVDDFLIGLEEVKYVRNGCLLYR